MNRRIASCLLVVFGAAVLLTLLAPSSCAVSAAHCLPRPAPAQLGGGGAGTWGSFRWSQAREGRDELAVGAARRLGQRESLDKPSSPKPHHMPGTARPNPPPPPPSDNE